MTHIGGKRGQSDINILTVAIPFKKAMYRKGVAKIMYPWPEFLSSLNSALFEELVESVIDCLSADSRAVLADEQRGLATPLSDDPLTKDYIFCQDRTGRL